MDQLLTDPTLRGKVTLLTEMRDTVGLTMLDLGYDTVGFHRWISSTRRSPSCRTPVDSGQIRRFTGNDYGADLVQGNVAACIAWTGDVVQPAGGHARSGVHPAGRRLHAVERQLRHPDPDAAQEERRDC